MRIGYLEDEASQSELVLSWLKANGHDVFHYDTGQGLIDFLSTNPVDMLLLDWQLPDMEGVDVLGKVRESLKLKMPVIFATQRDAEGDIVKALTLGADDYIVKPLREGELLARLTALARRTGINSDDQTFEVKNIEVDLNREQISLSGEIVKMTPKDYNLSVCLLKNIGKLLSREFLLKEVWGIDAQINTRTVDVHVSRVRRSLGLIPENGFCIRTIYQHGYRLELLDEAF